MSNPSSSSTLRSTPTDTEPPSVDQLKNESPPTRKTTTLVLGNTAPLPTPSTPTSTTPGVIRAPSSSAIPTPKAAKSPPPTYVPPPPGMVAVSPTVTAPPANPASPNPNYDFAPGRPVVDAGNPFNLPGPIAKKAKSSDPIVDENVALGLDSAKELTAMMERQVRVCQQKVQREVAEKMVMRKRIEELEGRLGEKDKLIAELMKMAGVARGRATTSDRKGESDDEGMEKFDGKSDAKGVEGSGEKSDDQYLDALEARSDAKGI